MSGLSKTTEQRMDRIGELIAEVQLEAVEAEKRRWAKLLSDAKEEAIVQKADYPLAAALRDIRDAGLGAKPEPEPPPPEPMTVEGFIEWLYIPFPRQRGTAEIRNRLQAFVNSTDQAQARRDAEIATGMAPVPLHPGAEGLATVALAISARIRKAAGLE